MQKSIKREDGTWKQYHKRSIGSDEVPQFLGWNKLLFIIDSCNRLPYDIYYKDYCRERDKAFISTLFLTGGRVGEVVALRKDNFDFDSNQDFCVVHDMLLEKKFQRIGSYYETVETMPKGAHAPLYEPKIFDDGKQVWIRKRWNTTITSPKAQQKRIRKPFPIFNADPLFPIMEAWIKRNHSNLLFPSPKRRKDGSRTMTQTNGWIIINRLQKITKIQMWPHWFRSQRASQLYHEWGLTWEELKLWFSWESIKMPQIYTKPTVQDLVARMLMRKQQITLNATKAEISRP